MEIIILPYMAVSFLIGWTIFAPFASVDDLHRLTFSRFEISDLFAIFLPLSVMLVMLKWAIPISSLSIPALTAVSVVVLGMVIAVFAVGLFLLAKLQQTTSMRRIAVIGVLVPVGALLTFAWVVLPLWAYTHSILFAIPATLVVLPITLALRGLSSWVCQTGFLSSGRS
jgi:hypothetical protein